MARKKVTPTPFRPTLQRITHRIFDPADLDMLVNSYEQNAYPPADEVDYLVSATSLSFRQIRKWFEKERYRRKVKSGIFVIQDAVFHPQWAIQILINHFEMNHYPTRPDVGRLADETGLGEKSVRKWFEKRRRRMREKQSVTLVDRKRNVNTVTIKEDPVE